MARALLHIGLEKTGTTAIQEFLQINRRLLLQHHKVWVPDYLGKGSQWLLAALAYDNTREDDLTRNLGSPASRQARLDETRRKITYSVRHQPAELFCFSSEHLSSRLTTTNELHTLQHFLRDLFNEITIVVYVREPIRMAISRQSTVVRLGLGSYQLPPPAQVATALDFRNVIERWEEAFNGNVCVRLYDETSQGFDLIADFCSMLKLSANQDPLTPPGRANPSLSWENMRLLSAINTAAREQSRGPLPGPVLRQITAILEQNTNGETGYQPTNAEQKDYADYFSEQTQWLFNKYFPERSYQWSPPSAAKTFPHPQPQASLHLTHSEEILCKLVVSLAESKTLALADIAEHLAQLAWKIREKEAFNQHDQEACERYSAEIRDAMSLRSRVTGREPANASTSGEA